MKRLLILSSMLTLAAGCATNQAEYPNPNAAAGAPDAAVTTSTGEAYSYPVSDVQPNEQGYQAAGITPPTTTDADVVENGVVETGAPDTSFTYDTDAHFLQRAAMEAQAQISLGQMILQKSSNPDLKSLGQRLIDDNTRADQQITQLASQKGVSLSNAPGTRAQNNLTASRIARTSTTPPPKTRPVVPIGKPRCINMPVTRPKIPT